jgi:hypothetical protein
LSSVSNKSRFKQSRQSEQSNYSDTRDLRIAVPRHEYCTNYIITTGDIMDKMEGRLLQDVVIRQCTTILELLAGKNQVLLGKAKGK